MRWPGSPRPTGIAPYRHGVPEFHHTDVLPLGPDATEYRRLDLPAGDLVDVPALGRQFLQVPPATLTALVRTAVRDISHLLRPSHLAQLRAIVDDPEASANDRFVATDLLRNACVSAGGVLPMCQDTGTAIVVGKRTETVLTGGNDEEAISRGVFEAYDSLEPALLADGAHVVLGRAQHRHEPARAGRAVQRAGRRPALRAAGDGQGRRLGQQDLPLPGDEGAAEPEAAGDVPRREAALAGHGGVPALPPGDRRRRDVGGVHAQGREAGVGALPGHAAGVRAPGSGTPSATGTWSSRCWS